MTRHYYRLTTKGKKESMTEVIISGSLYSASNMNDYDIIKEIYDQEEERDELLLQARRENGNR
jgi:hypothetical protein